MKTKRNRREQLKAIFASLRSRATPSGRRARREAKIVSRLAQHYGDLQKLNFNKIPSKSDVLNEILTQKRVARKEEEIRKELKRKYAGLDVVLASFLPFGLKPSEVMELKQSDIEERVKRAKELHKTRLEKGDVDLSLASKLEYTARALDKSDIDSQINHIDDLRVAGLMPDHLANFIIKRLGRKKYGPGFEISAYKNYADRKSVV